MVLLETNPWRHPVRDMKLQPVREGQKGLPVFCYQISFLDWIPTYHMLMFSILMSWIFIGCRLPICKGGVTRTLKRPCRIFSYLIWAHIISHLRWASELQRFLSVMLITVLCWYRASQGRGKGGVSFPLLRKRNTPENTLNRDTCVHKDLQSVFCCPLCLSSLVTLCIFKTLLRHCSTLCSQKLNFQLAWHVNWLQF